MINPLPPGINNPLHIRRRPPLEHHLLRDHPLHKHRFDIGVAIDRGLGHHLFAIELDLLADQVHDPDL